MHWEPDLGKAWAKSFKKAIIQATFVVFIAGVAAGAGLVLFVTWLGG